MHIHLKTLSSVSEEEEDLCERGWLRLPKGFRQMKESSTSDPLQMNDNGFL